MFIHELKNGEYSMPALLNANDIYKLINNKDIGDKSKPVNAGIKQIRGWLKEQEIPSFKLGKARVCSKEDFDMFLKKKRVIAQIRAEKLHRR